jgi:hypothetical protein
MWRKAALIGLPFGMAMAVSVPVLGALLSVTTKLIAASIGYRLDSWANLPIYMSMGPAVEEAMRSILILQLLKRANEHAQLKFNVISLGFWFGVFEMIQKIFWRYVDARGISLYDYGWMSVAVGAHVVYSLIFLFILKKFNFFAALTTTLTVHYFYNFLIVSFT